MDYQKNYEEWLANPYFDADTKAELEGIKADDNEIKERFYQELEFGTAGLRGIIGAGTNRMNIYTVRKATQGLANYILKKDAGKQGVAIAYDSRRMSPEFADEAALCLAANGIKAYVFESLRPTPELSYAVRSLKCIAGINITASHNPPEYNGYKVYWEDGAQITWPRDAQIMEEVKRVTDFQAVKTMEEEQARQQGLLRQIGEELDCRYLEELKKLVLEPEILAEEAGKLKIVYTPLHGTGNILVRRVLKELGFEQVYVVKEQELPDGDFPTVPSPNPEDSRAFAMALELAKEVEADLVIATDPDADRLGVYARDKKTGEYKAFTGNMSGMIICEYLLSRRKERGLLPTNGAVVTTIVSGKMAAAVCREYGAELIETLTGFKYIGEQIRLFEENGDREYLFGFEESYGCLVGTNSRDKDAVGAVMALCEAAAYYRRQGLTLWDQMECLYQKYGYYRESLHTLVKTGVDGLAEINSMMESMRCQPLTSAGGLKTVEFRDYGRDRKANVLYYVLEGGSWICIRPSGTEPKVKIYIGTRGETLLEAEDLLSRLWKDITVIWL